MAVTGCGQLMPLLGGCPRSAPSWCCSQRQGGDRRAHQLGQIIQMNAYLAPLVWPTLALGDDLALKRGQASWARCPTLGDEAHGRRRGRCPPRAGGAARADVEIGGRLVDGVTSR
jgi:hypothetical protein